MDIDFRAYVDPACGHTPQYLACDATHVGIRIKDLDNATIESPDSDKMTMTTHRKFDRVFLPIIKGAEGRKDAFSSLYKYMPEAPQEIYYDNTCSLNDYCFNRAPSFFRNSRFWFDIFHSVNHKCGHNHKCHDIPGLLHENTSICEQFNSSLKTLKFISTHLSQSRFCFLMQLIIHFWNTEKTKQWEQDEAHRTRNQARHNKDDEIPDAVPDEYDNSEDSELNTDEDL